jgi:hypothetical protein
MGVEPVHAAITDADIGRHIGARAIGEDDRKLGVDMIGGIVTACVTRDRTDRLTEALDRIGEGDALAIASGTADDECADQGQE